MSKWIKVGVVSIIGLETIAVLALWCAWQHEKSERAKERDGFDAIGRLYRQNLFDLVNLRELCRNAGIDPETGATIKAAEEIDRMVPRERARLRTDSEDLRKNALAVGRTGWVGKVRVFQVLDDTNMLVYWHGDDILMWVTGYSTRGIADGLLVQPTGIFEVCGTRRYTTASGGSKTVFAIRPMTPQ